MLGLTGIARARSSDRASAKPKQRQNDKMRSQVSLAFARQRN
jgi:hypothetical protein